MEKFVDFKKEKGITLVALVVTIIVLLILAAISIGILLGDNGVVGKAEESRDKTIIAQEKEYIKLAYQKLEMEKAVNGGDITAENLNTELKNYDDKTKVNEIQQSEIGDREIVIKKENSSEYGEIIFEETGHEYVVSLEIDPNKTRYIITYNANGGYGGPTSQTKVEGTDLIITSLTPERKGYLFLGWSESASGNSIQYEAGDRYTKEESKTLYAVWQRNWTDADAVAQIGNTKYPSIQEAVEACSKSAGNTQTTIILLKNTEEEFVTYEGQNIILDLKGFTVTSESTGTLCTNNAKLQIINGVLKSNQGTSITNNGEITIGDNSTGIDDNTPVIYGNKVGVENNGVFNFYDGKIQGFVPIQGTVTNTPDQYGPVSTGYENNITTIQLRILTQYEARIEWVYYTTLREAVNATQNYENDYKDTVTLIKDIQLENTLEISEEKALILDLNGYTLTILPGQKGIINNHGNLNIANNNIEKNGNIKIETMDAYYGVYNLYGNLKITGGIIDCINNGNQSNYGIYNESGNVEIIEGSVRSSNSGNYFENYGIYNSNGTVKAIGGIINSSSNGNYSKSYGIYNNMGNVTIEDEGTIISSNSGDYGDCCGIYNNNGVIKVLEGSVSSNGSNFNMNSNGIYNASTGSIEVQGGIISSIGTDTNIYSNGIYNASTGSIIITGGTINTLGISYSNGIYNASTGNVKIIQGEIISNTDNGYGNGIYNFGEGNIEVIGGTINCNGYNNSYAIFNLGEKNIIIGSKENELNRESPIIKVNTYYSGYGCGIFTKSGVEFYNGSIQGDVAILGGIENIRDGYKIENIIENQKELIYLVEKIDNDYIAQIDEIQYMSLQKAIDSLNPNEEKTIKIIKDFELEENIIFNKNIILDLNGHIITNNYYRIENVQTLKVTDTSGGKLESINTIFGILNGKNGSIEMLGGTINSISRFYGGVSYGIYNSEGTVTIIDGTVSSKGSSSSNSYGIYNDNGNVELLGGNVKSEGTSSSSYGIGNSKGTIKVENGIINSSSTRYSYGIYNSNGTIIIEGGEITSSSSSSNSYGISNSNGILTISDGIIISKCENKYDGTSRGIDNSNGIVKITGGTIMSNTNTRNISYSCGIYNSKGTIEIIKGTIISGATNSNSYGIYNNKGDIIIGTKGDGVVSQEEPYIKSEYTGTSNSYNGYGIYNITEKLYFYDGKIEGSTKVVYDTITEYEDNTQLNYNEDETILTLSTILTPVAQIGNTTYNTLEEAISVVGSSQTTIKLLRNVSYTTNSTVIMIPENKNIVLDLNGYKISSSIPERTIENNGTLEITDTSVTQTGTIVTSEEKTVSNMLGAKLTISGGIIENRNKCSIYNEGNIELVSGNLTVKSSEEAYGIYNANSGSAILAGGIISCNNSDNIIEGSSKSYGIYNEGIGNVKVIGGTINSKNGSSYGIYNKNSGNIEMSSGTINSDSYNYSYGIYNESTGSIEIIGGTVNCISYYSSNYGIYNKDNGSITIGFKEDEKISQEEPEIRGEYTGKYSSEYGYGISNLNGNLYFYDGKISGSTKGIVGNISELEEKTELQIIEETIDNRVNEVIILQPKPSNVARVNGVEYDSIEKAVKACGTNTSTITILRDSDPGATLIIENNQNITIDLNGYTINNYIEMQNKGTLKITDSSSGQTGKIVGLVGIAVSNSGTMELQSGAIADSGYGIKNTGTLTINGGTISNNTYGIYNDGNGTTTVRSGNIISNTYGIYNYSGTTNLNNVEMQENKYGVYNAGGTTNIKEGVQVQSNTGIYVANGTVNIGEQGTMNPESPLIIGETYGLSVSATGTVYMYDGQIKGKTGATQGYITYTETGYAVANKVEGEYYVDYLALAGTISTVAEVNGVSYSNLQSAINSVVGTDPQTIKLTNGIITNMTFIIAEGQNIILDMNEKTITSTADVTINNAGNLTIIDSTGSGVGKISSTTGTAIVNSGTLTLGQNDGTVIQNVITIEGQTYGIETTGKLNFYDGTIIGTTAIEGEITNMPSGYKITTNMVSGKENAILTK